MVGAMILVGYASAHGSTREIAERIGVRLEAEGLAVATVPMNQEVSVANYEAAVLGSAIHGGEWLPEAAEFLRRNAAALGARPVWLFSVASVGDRGGAFLPPVSWLMRTMMKRTRWPRNVAPLDKAIGSRDHRAFAGVIRPDQYPRSGRFIQRAMGGRFGDHRDWADIERWADRIAGELSSSIRPTAE
jgi:menaquinone-dependent protoporphyrinogen oxidase